MWCIVEHGGKQTWRRPSVLSDLGVKGCFASVASFRKREFSSVYCKQINASRETSSHTSSTVVRKEKPGEREEEEITWDERGEFIIQHIDNKS